MIDYLDDSEVDSVIETLDDVFALADLPEEEEWEARKILAEARDRLFW